MSYQKKCVIAVLFSSAAPGQTPSPLAWWVKSRTSVLAAAVAVGPCNTAAVQRLVNASGLIGAIAAGHRASSARFWNCVERGVLVTNAGLSWAWGFGPCAAPGSAAGSCKASDPYGGPCMGMACLLCAAHAGGLGGGFAIGCGRPRPIHEHQHR